VTVEHRSTSVVPPVIFVLGSTPCDDEPEPIRRWGVGWPLFVLVAVVVLLTTGGGVALSARQASPMAPASATAQLQQDTPGVVRIENSKWIQPSGGGPRQLLVTYRSRSSGSAAALLAWSGHEKRWVSLYRGAPRTSDVLAPAGSALDGSVALALIGAVDRLSHGSYDIAPTPANVALLEVWMAHEGGLWANNPLNTSLDASAYPDQFTTSGQDTGIPIYPDLSVGVTDTALTLLGNTAYARILKVLAGGSGSCIAFGAAVVESPWAASHYGYDAGSFCPSGRAQEVAVSTPIAAGGGSSSAGSSGVHAQHSGHQARRRADRSHRASGSTGTVVSGQPAIRAGG